MADRIVAHTPVFDSLGVLLGVLAQVILALVKADPAPIIVLALTVVVQQQPSPAEVLNEDKVTVVVEKVMYARRILERHTHDTHAGVDEADPSSDRSPHFGS